MWMQGTNIRAHYNENVVRKINMYACAAAIGSLWRMTKLNAEMKSHSGHSVIWPEIHPALG